MRPLITPLTEERSLAERVERRIDIENFFARAGRTYRKSRFKLWRERHVVPRLLKVGLQMTGLYPRGLENALHPAIRQLRLECDRLPPAFDGFTLLHLSDFHIDGNPALAGQLVSVIRGLTPDLCVFTGDYRFDTRGSSDGVYAPMRSIVSSISSQHGVFGILGNHDAAEIAFALEAMGIRMLVNAAVEISNGSTSLWLAGVDDPFDYRCDDLPGALSVVPPEAFRILLAHTPDLYKEAAERSVDVYLCGHTHGGQIRFPLIGALDHNSTSPRRYAYGPLDAQTDAGVYHLGRGLLRCTGPVELPARNRPHRAAKPPKRELCEIPSPPYVGRPSPSLRT